MIILSKEQVKHLHRKLLERTGGLDGIHRLYSCGDLSRAFSSRRVALPPMPQRGFMDSVG
jgi:hypothetical protein